jgi:hypothetical protein
VLPTDWRAAVKNDTQCSSSGNIKSIQLVWRHRRLLTDNGKVLLDQIYLAEYEVTNKGRRSITHAFLKENVAIYYLQCEPWVTDCVHSLCSVRSYRNIIFGEGAKTSHANVSTSQASTSGDLIKNFWYCEENEMKICAEGAVANMLYHMNLKCGPHNMWTE